MLSKRFFYNLLSIILVSFAASVFIVFADNPLEPFTPDDNIQDPDCTPNDSNCYVTVSTEISSLDPASATNTINNSNYLQEWQWNTLAGGTALKLSSNSTLASGGTQKLFEVALSGANGNDSEITYAGYFANTHTGTDSTNVGLYATASGGTNNTAIWANGSITLEGVGGGIEFINNGSSSLSIGISNDVAPDVSNSLFFRGGSNATNASNSVFIGDESGSSATNADDSIFIGHQSGQNATNANDSIFLGDTAGANASGASNSTFIGWLAGAGATNASNSFFVGLGAGTDSLNASNSIFIGAGSGNSDTSLDNTGGGYSILIGPSTYAGGNSNSIAMGRGATNTASNQLVFGSDDANSYISSVFWGTGVTATSPQGVTLNGSGALGSDVAGASLTLAGGKATGNATGGALIFQTSDAGASGSTLQSLSTKAILLASGNFGIGDTNPSSLLTVASSSLTSGSLASMTVTGTGALTGQKGINVSLSGANASGSQTTYGIYSDNSHSGTNPHNYGIYGGVSNGSTVSAGVYGNNSGTGGYGVYGVASSGLGVYGSSSSSYGIQGTTTSGGYAGYFQANPASTNTTQNVLALARLSSGTASNGIGGMLVFINEASDSAGYQSAGIASTWTDVTVGTRTGDLEFYTTNSASSSVKMTLLGNGNLGVGDNSPDYLLDVENTGIDNYIFALHDSDGECLHDPEAGAETVTCSSDERLKTNIEDAESVLEYLNSFRIRNYEVVASGNNMTGVIAQEVLETHPELVSKLSNGMYSVQLPNEWKLVKGIQELDIKLQDIEDFDSGGSSFGKKLNAWFDQRINGIKKLFVQEEICIGATCVNEEQLKILLDNANLNRNGSSEEGDNSNEEDSIGDIEIFENPPIVDESTSDIINTTPAEEVTPDSEATNEPEEIINQEEQTNEENQSSN